MSMTRRDTASGRYLTDGRRLFRHLGHLGDPLRDGLVQLEDCRSLDVVLVPWDEFRDLRLRTVRPEAAAA